MKLKPYLGGAALAAMVMAGVPALAQTSPGAAPNSGAPAASEPSGSTQAPSSTQQHKKKRSTAHRQQHKKPSQARSGSSQPDAQQLNSQELQRIQQGNR